MREYLKKLPGKVKIAFLAGAVILIIILIAVVVLVGGRKKVDPSKGVQVIQKMEKTKVAPIEQEIDDLNRVEDERRKRLESGMTSAETFSEGNAVVMGDTFAQGFVDNGVLGASNVVAQEDIKLTDEEELQGQIDSVKGLNPAVLFVFLGSEDIPETDGDTELFRERYKKILVEIQRAFSDATVYAVLIPPVQSKAYSISTAYERVDKYNSVIRELCRENNLIAIDTSTGINEDMYESDGLNFNAEYYEACAEHLIEMAGL